MLDIATLPQAQKVLELLAQKRVTCEHLDLVLGSGLLADLFDEQVQWMFVDRIAVRKALGFVTLKGDDEKKDAVPQRAARKFNVTITELPGIVLPPKEQAPCRAYQGRRLRLRHSRHHT